MIRSTPLRVRDVLLDRDLVRRALLEVARRSRRRRPRCSRGRPRSRCRSAPNALQRAEPVVEAAHRPVVDVEVELEAGAEQDVGGVLHVGDARVAERPHEDRVVVPREVVEGARGERLPGLQIVVRAPGEEDRLERDPASPADALQDLDGLGGDVHADSVPGNHGDFHEPAAKMRHEAQSTTPLRLPAPTSSDLRIAP